MDADPLSSMRQQVPQVSTYTRVQHPLATPLASIEGVGGSWGWCINEMAAADWMDSIASGGLASIMHHCPHHPSIKRTYTFTLTDRPQCIPTNPISTPTTPAKSIFDFIKTKQGLVTMSRLLRKGLDTLGKALRETGQALDRAGLEALGKDPHKELCELVDRSVRSIGRSIGSWRRGRMGWGWGGGRVRLIVGGGVGLAGSGQPRRVEPR